MSIVRKKTVNKIWDSDDTDVTDQLSDEIFGLLAIHVLYCKTCDVMMATKVVLSGIPQRAFPLVEKLFDSLAAAPH